MGHGVRNLTVSWAPHGNVPSFSSSNPRTLGLERVKWEATRGRRRRSRVLMDDFMFVMRIVMSRRQGGGKMVRREEEEKRKRKDGSRQR